MTVNGKHPDITPKDKRKKKPGKKRWIFFLLGFLFLCGAIYFIVDEPKPKGEKGAEAEVFAQKMLLAINDEAWEKTNFVSWKFMDRHFYVWDKKRHLALVEWDDIKVVFDINRKEGFAWEKGKTLKEKALENKVDKAWKYWVNDSFWLNPISKIFDQGTERSLVDLEDGQKGLLVTYTKGGNTPGDSYLWTVDEGYVPNKWKLWVSIIPIGGVEFSWEDWISTETGVQISTLHKGRLIDIKLSDVKTANNYSDFNFEGEDPFTILE
ncbi:hypothetical protein [Xanthovirga aplysinae]|uniref:hypothetical protein n=1 Tax=Xanthovirga aplysinae TaxID=2529853 RepID=UPI0012BC2E2A|nr:hypothetical protein [Xanthovirga aplysinae]MTI32586.1 hypothetical protein [Xanthovirga aplysinae]